MTTHVFIVDATTFRFHLEYLFAGTGAKDCLIDFNNKTDTDLYPTTENMLVSMIADASRIREGDLIIFYLQQNYSQGIIEGKFYGVFKARNDGSFLDNNDDKQYLKDKLKKSLTFRTLIKPLRVYQEGVTEWEALDEIKTIRLPHQMLWSLIYRKLKGNRGNTMITIYESERLIRLIRNKNKGRTVSCSNRTLSFDPSEQKIICLERPAKGYQGRKDKIDTLPRLITKLDRHQSFEPHLQAYIIKYIGKSANGKLNDIVFGNANIEWLGNEVSCGVGMQRIDIMLSVVKKRRRICIPIELKSVKAKEENVKQIQRYVDWIEQYYIPERKSDILPVLITKESPNKTSDSFKKLVNKFLKFNSIYKDRCRRLKYVEYKVVGKDLVFNEINY